MKPSIRPSIASAPAPTPAPVETAAPEPTEEPKRVTFPTWHIASHNNYWTRPLRNGEASLGLEQLAPIADGNTTRRRIVNTRTSSTGCYDSIYIEADRNAVFALTLGLAASFDATGTSDPIKP